MSSSPNLPDGSRQNPGSDSFTQFTDGSRENPTIIPESDDEPELAYPPGLEGFHSIFNAIQTMHNRNFEEEEEEEEEKQREKRRKTEEDYNRESRRRDEERAKQTAKHYALELHSELNPKLVQKKFAKGDVKGKFQEAKEVITKRKEAKFGDHGFSVVTERKAPSLMEMSMKVFAKNSEAIQSLKLVPDHLKKKLSSFVSDLSKVDARFMKLLINDSPNEVFSKNCTGLVEEDLVKLLCECDMDSLKVLSLDLCGRAMTETAVIEFVKRSPEGFPALTTLSLKGAFCLTDNGLDWIARSAPCLQFVNLSECSFLSFNAVKILAENFGWTLRGLNIGGCQGIKACDELTSSLCAFVKLSYLSVVGLERIHETVVDFVYYRGLNLTDLSLATCNEVTDVTIWSVAKYCPKLETLDISEIDNMTDDSLEYITDSCRFLNSVKFTRNQFSDEAVAAFLEVCGGSLEQLCLNNVRDVGHQSAFSPAKNCKRLRHLDLSWCRKLTEGELKLILSSCTLLKSLRLFGWTQVEDEFLEELSRAEVCITGLKMTSVFANLDDSYPSVDAKFF